jgi:hypothetical protein
VCGGCNFEAFDVIRISCFTTSFEIKTTDSGTEVSATSGGTDFDEVTGNLEKGDFKVSGAKTQIEAVTDASLRIADHIVNATTEPVGDNGSELANDIRSGKE